MDGAIGVSAWVASGLLAGESLRCWVSMGYTGYIAGDSWSGVVSLGNPSPAHGCLLQPMNRSIWRLHAATIENWGRRVEGTFQALYWKIQPRPTSNLFPKGMGKTPGRADVTISCRCHARLSGTSPRWRGRVNWEWTENRHCSWETGAA